MTTSQLVSDHDLITIGFRLGTTEMEKRRDWVDIESTLLNVIDSFTDDYRVTSVFMSWIKIHGKYVIIEKLAKLYDKAETTRKPSPWMSFVAAWAVECGYHKWRKLITEVSGPVYLYDPEVTESAIVRKGILPWLPLGFRVPRNSLRIRESDVLTPKELIATNRQYRNRYLYGASWRADIVTAIENGITTPMEISRTVGCSYEPAHRISHDYILGKQCGSGRHTQ
ncbi:MAG: hypothetical protein LIQ31_12070 [Planctomycetes bacterium]|nr:hypothetical protein [Planctomycetota bacterium]